MEGFINEPRKISLLLRAGIRISERVTGKKMLPARLLAWYPRAAVGSGILESLAAHKDKNLSPRLLKLLRMQTSFTVSCPFCIDMNSSEYSDCGIIEDEIKALQGMMELADVSSFSKREQVALQYARCASATPVSFSPSLISLLKSNFTEREIVILASTISQVNYWARLIQSLGIPPAGFSESCEILHLERFNTFYE